MDRSNNAESRWAVLDRLHRYCTAVDSESVDALLDCFTRDATFSWAPAENAGLVLDLRGHDAFATWFHEHRLKYPVGFQMHFVLHPVISVEGREARSYSRYMTIRLVNDAYHLATMGTYSDRLVMCDDAEWRLSERRAVASNTGGKPLKPPG